MSKSTPRKASSSFIDLYLDGKVLADDIDDFIDSWHTQSSDINIYDFLGFSEEEYSAWLRDPDSLPHIACARLKDLPLSTVISTAVAEMPIAARSTNSANVRRLMHWLEKNGKLT